MLVVVKLTNPHQCLTGMKLNELPYGTVIEYRKKLYWVSKGLDHPIVTDTDGHWHFIHELRWRTWKIVFSPNLTNV